MRLFILVSFVFWAAAMSAHALTPPDSIGIERKGKKNLVLYKVAPGETLFGITRKYRTTISQVQQLNPTISKRGIQVGQVIKVPALSSSSEITPSPATPMGAQVEKLHVVASGQTLYAISRLYKVSVKDLMAWNHLATGGLNEGQQLIVSLPHQHPADPARAKEQQEAPAKEPVAQAPAKEQAPATESTASPTHKVKTEAPKPAKEEPAVIAEVVNEKPAETPKPAEPKPEPAKPETAKPAEPVKLSAPGEPIKHTVKTGETLFGIARQYNTKVDIIKAENHLTEEGVRVGQVITIRKGPATDAQTLAAAPAAPVAQRVAEAKGEEPIDTTLAKNGMPAVAGYERIVEHGIAELVDNEAGSRNYFCLHRTAPIGKILQVVNEMNGAKVFVRVIGKLPETGNNDKISIKISRKAFEALAAPDKRFPVEITYPNN